MPTMSRCSCDSRLRAFGATTTAQTTTATATATTASAGPADLEAPVAERGDARELDEEPDGQIRDCHDVLLDVVRLRVSWLS